MKIFCVAPCVFKRNRKVEIDASVSSNQTNFTYHTSERLIAAVTRRGRFGFDLIYDGDSEQVSLWQDVGVPALGKAFAGAEKVHTYTPTHTLTHWLIS